ncbi:MAG: MFS transporter [Acidobacteriota bacterium]|nr:MFS transporter [Acidobacteriota bacterium]
MAEFSVAAMRSQVAAVVGSARVRAAASYPFRLGPADSDWKSRPFAGLAVVNNLSGSGDALVTVALAGSVFVSVSLNAARGRTALGLICTVLPFAVVGPFVGPAIDRMRGGRRLIVFLAAAGRLVACLLMAAWIHSLLLFPAAFLSLVCSKTHAVAKAALVPAVVDGEQDLVRANSRLAVGGAAITSLAAGVGGLIYKLLGSRVLLDLDVFVFAACAGLCLQLLGKDPEPKDPEPKDPEPVGAAAHGPRRRFAPGGPQPPVGAGPGFGLARLAARLAGRFGAGGPLVVARPLRLASVAMAGMRAVAGFLTALVIFAFRRGDAPLFWYGLVAVASVGGNFGGAILAPRLRPLVTERLLVGAAAVLIGVTAVGLTFFSAWSRRPAAVGLALVVALGASLAKTAFDAIVQRDTPDRDRSRLFAGFESVFQLAWVGGALLPTLLPIPLLVGFLLVAVIVASTSTVFVAGLARDGWVPPAPAAGRNRLRGADSGGGPVSWSPPPPRPAPPAPSAPQAPRGGAGPLDRA